MPWHFSALSSRYIYTSWHFTSFPCVLYVPDNFIFLKEFQTENPIDKPGRRWEYYIKLYLKGIGFELVD
jgi:hypothetical protein